MRFEMYIVDKGFQKQQSKRCFESYPQESKLIFQKKKIAL